jgi:hypothetical protein
VALWKQCAFRAPRHSQLSPYCDAQTPRINRFAAKQYCALACARVAEDNCNKEKFTWRKFSREATDFAATGL